MKEWLIMSKSRKKSSGSTGPLTFRMLNGNNGRKKKLRKRGRNLRKKEQERELQVQEIKRQMVRLSNREEILIIENTDKRERSTGTRNK